MPIELVITGNDWAEIKELLRVGAEDSAVGADEMSLQELLLYADQRATAEGYEIEVRKPTSDTRKEAAKASLRGDVVVPIKKKVNGAAAAPPEDPTARKARCLLRLQELYGSSRKKEVNQIMKDHGGGLKNFALIPEENFGPIAAALEALGQ